MRLSALRSPALALVLASYVVADGDVFESPSDVVKLTSATFDDSINNAPLILVEFFAPWYAASSLSVCLLIILALGADIARPLPLITRKLRPRSRKRTLHLLLLTAWIRLTCVRRKKFKDTRKPHHSLPVRKS
jgi:hypothetical protein